jgi:hypothetical protein
MATILDRYGIKEVADVTFYEINENGQPGKPVLYLDTLKVSTIEQTAESTDARGGKGNAALITWDYGKEITVSLEDALYSAKSLALQYGDVDSVGAAEATVRKTLWKENMNADNVSAVINGVEITLEDPDYYKADGTEGSADEYAYVTGTFKAAGAYTIDVSANSFPGTYYVTGDTYARSEATGKDEFFQFILPKAKVLSESNTITLEAEGDPTVFSMSLKVLRPKDGVMMKLVQYNVSEANA